MAVVVRARPMVRATEGIKVAPRPQLTVVVPRRRRAARIIVAGCSFAFVLMLGAAAFQTQLARRQVELDQLDRGVAEATSNYEVLRSERAALRAPQRLAVEAANLGMHPASNGDFMTVTPEVVALVQQSAGFIDDSSAATGLLDQFRTVKSVAGGAP